MTSQSKAAAALSGAATGKFTLTGVERNGISNILMQVLDQYVQKNQVSMSNYMVKGLQPEERNKIDYDSFAGSVLVETRDDVGFFYNETVKRMVEWLKREGINAQSLELDLTKGNSTLMKHKVIAIDNDSIPNLDKLYSGFFSIDSGLEDIISRLEASKGQQVKAIS